MGTLAHASGIDLTVKIQIDRKTYGYLFAQKTRVMTRAGVEVIFASL